MLKIIFITAITVFIFSPIVFSQPPKSGTYLLKYFDIEYNKINGTCKLILKNDSATVYAVKDCHRNPGELIEKGKLEKDKKGRWTIYQTNEDNPPVIDFRKKTFYSL